MQMMRHTLEFSSKLSLRTLVNLEFLKGMCFLEGSESAVIHYPSADRELLIEVNSCTLMFFSAGGRSLLIVYFSLPAKSTILIFDLSSSPFSCSFS